MNTLYDSLSTTQGITFLDDVMFSDFFLFNNTIATNQVKSLIPPAGFTNPIIATNQGVGGAQLYLFLRSFDVALYSTPHNFNFPNTLNNPRNAAASDFFTSASVPASAVGNVQLFQFNASTTPFPGFPNFLTRTVFFPNANINVTAVMISGDNVHYQSVAAPGVLSSSITTDYIGVYGSQGAFLPNAGTGIFVQVTVNNTAASAQTYSFSTYGSIDITEYMLYSLQYQDIAGTFHQLAFIDNKVSLQNIPLNMLIQVPIQATTKDFGNLVLIPKFAFSPLNSDLVLFYALTATFAYQQLGAV